MGYARCEVKPNSSGVKKLPKSWDLPVDISLGKATTFAFNYEWSQNNCTISNIEWYPTQLIDGEWTSSGVIFGTDEEPFFSQPNKIEIKFGGESINISDNSTLNSGSASGVTKGNISSSYLSSSFKYSYTVKYDTATDAWVAVNDNDELGEYSFIEYLIKIDNIRIPKTSKYENNVVFTERGVNELLKNIKNYPIIDITSVESNTTDTDDNNIWNYYTGGKPCIKIDYGDRDRIFEGYTTTSAQTAGYKYVAVGSNIKFKKPNGEDVSSVTTSNDQNTGTFRVNIDGVTYEVPIKGFTNDETADALKITGHLLPSADDEYDIGSGDKDAQSKLRWRNLYLSGSLGNSDNYIPNAYITNLYSNNLGSASSPVSQAYITNLGDTNKYVSNAYITDLTLGDSSDTTSDNSGNLKVINTKNAVTPDDTISTKYSANDKASINTSGGIYAAKDIWGRRVFNAVFNDYAECRTTIDLTPGHVVVDQDDGSLICSNRRLQPGAQVISDTYGHLMGVTETATTPIAVAGRVLVYPYQLRTNYHAGMAVCSAPNGTVDIMTRDEIRDYPDCIIGIVSEIPEYETWGSNNVKVDGRIWIKIK